MLPTMNGGGGNENCPIIFLPISIWVVKTCSTCTNKGSNWKNKSLWKNFIIKNIEVKIRNLGENDKLAVDISGLYYTWFGWKDLNIALQIFSKKKKALPILVWHKLVNHILLMIDRVPKRCLTFYPIHNPIFDHWKEKCFSKELNFK